MPESFRSGAPGVVGGTNALAMKTSSQQQSCACFRYESTNRFEASVNPEIVAPAAPHDGVPEEAADPCKETGDILERQQPPPARRERIAERPSRCRPWPRAAARPAPPRG